VTIQVSDVMAVWGPQPFPRVPTDDRDELGYPFLDDDCPVCGAAAVIINEWDAAECLTCSWREFGPNSPRATFRDWETTATAGKD
jgi:hypothetical protein